MRTAWRPRIVKSGGYWRVFWINLNCTFEPEPDEVGRRWPVFMPEHSSRAARRGPNARKAHDFVCRLNNTDRA